MFPTADMLTHVPGIVSRGSGSMSLFLVHMRMLLCPSLCNKCFASRVWGSLSVAQGIRCFALL